MRLTGIALCLMAGLATAQTQQSYVFTQTSGERELLEAATLVRAITEIRDLKADKETKTITINATPEQALAFQWLAGELNQPANPQRNGPQRPILEKREFGMGENDVVRVFYLPAGIPVTDLQEEATLIRALGEMRRLFIYNALRLIAIRGTPEQLTLAEWLLAQLNGNQKRATMDMRLTAPDDVVRVTFADPALSPAELQSLATQARSASGVRRLFTYNAARVIAARGTLPQLEQLSLVVKQ